MSIPRNSVFASERRPLLATFLAVRVTGVLLNLFAVVLPLGGLMLAAAYLLPPHVFDGVAGYAPLHTILEIFAIIVAAQVFGAGWFGYGDRTENGAVVLACVFLAAAVLDIGHLLSYAGMPDFITANSPHKAILFWFAARYVVLLGLVLMIVSNSLPQLRHYPKIPILAITLILLLGLFWLLLTHEHAFPATFVQGEGLTPFKVAMEYGLVVPYFVCALIMFGIYDRRGDRTFQLMGYASAVFGVSELCFTLYTSVADIFNILGHLYKVFAFALVYRALFISNVRRPYQQLEHAHRRLEQVAHAVSGGTGKQLLLSMARELSELLGMEYVVISESDRDREGEIGQILIAEGDHEIYPVSGLRGFSDILCQDMGDDAACIINNDIQRKYPQEKLLRELNIRSYVGIRLQDSRHNPVGILVLLGSNPLAQDLPADDLMRIFAARVGSELERMRTDSRLAESEQQLRSILTNIQDSVFRTDEQGCLVWLTPSAELLTGYSLAEMQGRHIEAFEAQSGDYQAFMTALEQGRGSVSGHETRIRRKDGGDIWVSINAQYYHDEAGRVLGIEGSVRNIQDRKEAELELLALNQALETKVEDRTRLLQDANRELEAFAYSVSHDLRAPLRHISGFAGLLERSAGDELGARAREYIERINDGCRTMGELIEDLLKLSQATRHELVREKVDVSALSAEVVNGLTESASEREVHVDIQPGMCAISDTKLLRVVLENLVGNAWKFTAGRNQALIRIGCRQEEGRTVYFVSDNGAGFNMQYADRLFTPFQRLHSSDDYDGTGVGLATVHRIINRHGGTIWAEAEKGEGAIFYFTLGEEE